MSPWNTRTRWESKGVGNSSVGVWGLLAIGAILAASLSGCATKQESSDSSGEVEAEAEEPTAESEENSEETDSPGADAGSAESPDGGDEKALWLDRDDLHVFFDAFEKRFEGSEAVAAWEKADESGTKALVGVVPFENEVSPRFGSSITALASHIETYLVNNTPTDVAAVEMHSAELNEAFERHDEGEDLKAIVAFGREVGIDYVVTGTVASDEKPTEAAGRLEYRTTFRVIDVDKGDVAWETTVRVEKSE